MLVNLKNMLVCNTKHLIILSIFVCVNTQLSLPPYTNMPDQIVGLAVFEEDLASELYKIRKHLSIIPKEGEGGVDALCHLQVFKYIAEFDEDALAFNNRKGLARAAIIAENPLLILKMIRRVVKTLLRNTMESCRNKVIIVETIQTIFKKYGITRPTEQSLDEALKRVLMVHFIYGYNDTNELSKGMFNDLDTKVVLNFHDCFALGKLAMEHEWLHLAYQWMARATLRLHEEEVLDLDTRELYDSWDDLVAISSYSSVPALQGAMHDKRQEELTGTGLTFQNYALCRGEVKMPVTPDNYQLNCSYEYDFNPFFTIHPLKVEMLSSQPRVLQFHDFVTDLEIDRLNSVQLLASGGKNDPILLQVNRRIEMVTGLKIWKSKYKGNLFFQKTLESSLGSLCQQSSGELLPCTTLQQTKTLAAFSLNLKDVPIGGYSAFPGLGLISKPMKGSAIFFYNIDVRHEYQKHLQVDLRMNQISCPVIIGSKQVAKWDLVTPPAKSILKCPS